MLATIVIGLALILAATAVSYCLHRPNQVGTAGLEPHLHTATLHSKGRILRG